MISLQSHLRRFSLQSHFKKLPINKFLFSSNEQKGDKVFIDQDAIQKKMKELKERNKNQSQDEIRKKKGKDFMPVFTIPEVNQKINTFRRQTRTQDIFSFSDITLQEKPTLLQITGYDQDFIQIDNFEYPPSVILTPNQVLNWEVQSPQMLKIEDFALLKCLQPIPDYVIIGIQDSSLVKQDLREKLKKIHHNIDVLDLFEAISQFNTVTDNDKYCVAFLNSS